MMKWPMVPKIHLGFSVAILLLVLIGVAAYHSMNQLVSTIGLVTHTYQVLERLEAILSRTKDIETGVWGYLLTRDEHYLSPYDDALETLPRVLQELRTLIVANPGQTERFKALEALIVTQNALMTTTVEERRNDTLALREALDLTMQAKKTMDDIRQRSREMKNEERTLLRQRWESAAVSTRNTKIVIVAGSFCALLFVVVASIVVQRDSTRRRRAEEAVERLRHHNELILHSAGEGILGLDMQGKATLVNPAAAKIVGYEVEEMLGQFLHDLLHHSRPDGTPHAREECPTLQMLHNGLPLPHMEGVYWRKDGTSVPVEYTSTPIREGDAIVGAVVVFQDISERQAVERMKDEFVSVVSHELRTPLTSIRGSLGLLASGRLGALPATGQRLLEIAVQNTDRLVRLINDILDIECMESGKITMTKKACDAATLMLQAADVMRSMAEQSGITLTVSPLAAQLLVDPDRIVQTLTNLISNAIKFSSPDTTVALTAERQGGEIILRVTDQGRGISADKLDTIFERFQQLDASDAREKGGTGLGLAICRSIVQQHGGRIWAESTPGVGSAFSFTLPVVQEESTVSAPIMTSNALTAVLVCDDDTAILTVVQAMLEQRGYRVVTAASGQEAVIQAAQQHPAVILLDLLMPGMDGWATIAALKAREDTQAIPIVILSVLAPEESPLPPEEVAGWVRKPFEEATLLQVLQDVGGKVAKTAKVLIVEDDLDLARVLTAMFERHGITTFHAQTGREAIHISQRTMPDLLVLDLIMPDCDGFAVVDWLRHHDHLHRIPLVVYSAKDLSAAEREQLTLGETRFLTKGRIVPEAFEQQILDLLTRIMPT
jgi:PAS domain S-box-containing protein